MTPAEQAYWAQRMTEQQQSAYGNYLQGLNGLTGLGNYAGTLGGAYTTAGTAATSNVLYINPQVVMTPSPSPKAVVADEIAWLRGRVDEMCWKAA